MIRTGVLAGLMILSAAATVLARLNLPDVPDVLITNSPLYLSVTLVLLLAAGAVSLTTLKKRLFDPCPALRAMPTRRWLSPGLRRQFRSSSVSSRLTGLPTRI